MVIYTLDIFMFKSTVITLKNNKRLNMTTSEERYKLAVAADIAKKEKHNREFWKGLIVYTVGGLML